MSNKSTTNQQSNTVCVNKCHHLSV